MTHPAKALNAQDPDFAKDLASLQRDLAWASSELSYVAHSMVGERSDMLSDLLLSICLALREDGATLGRHLARPAVHEAAPQAQAPGA